MTRRSIPIGGVSNVDMDGNNALQIKAIGVAISTFETLPLGDSHPWKAIAGSWRASPDRADIERNLQEYRQQVDTDPDRL